MIRRPPRSTLFPYTRSSDLGSPAERPNSPMPTFATWEHCGRCSPATASMPTSTSPASRRSEEHTSELQSRLHLVCRLLLEKKKQTKNNLYSLIVSGLTTNQD